jgi:CheY-like chemotaxis protein
MLVDDNQVQSATRRAILQSTGKDICSASNGKQALELLAEVEPAKPIGLIVTDHLMPVMDGPDFVAEVRRRGYTVPIVVLSGLPDAEMAYNGLDIVFQLKPCNPENLILLVHDLLGDCMRRSA